MDSFFKNATIAPLLKWHLRSDYDGYHGEDQWFPRFQQIVYEKEAADALFNFPVSQQGAFYDCLWYSILADLQFSRGKAEDRAEGVEQLRERSATAWTAANAVQESVNN